MDRLLEATARAERDHFWFRGLRRFVQPLLDDASRSLLEDASRSLLEDASRSLLEDASRSPLADSSRRALRILDCGCGTGNNLHMLRRHGRAVGIDITWSGLAYARARGERQVARASATALPFAPDHFDLVASFDVLYAFDDEMERDALDEMYRVLRPGGHLIVNVAALKALTGNHSILGGEVRRYHRRELRDHLARTGFTVRRLTYTNFTLLPIVAAVRLAQRFIGRKASDREISVPATPINVALAGALAVEAAALRVTNMPLGSSLLALAQKPYRTGV